MSGISDIGCRPKSYTVLTGFELMIRGERIGFLKFEE